MAKRFIKLYEQITAWEWFRYPNTLSLFIYLLLKANYKETSIHGRVIRRGQIVTSLPKIATDTGLSIQQTRTALLHLISTGEVTDESNPHYRVITVVKYDDYQTSTDKSTDNQQTTNRQLNRQVTDNLTPCIEYIEQIEDIERIEQINNTPASRAGGQDDSFSVFWEAYPKKVSKPDAMKAWKKLKPNAKLMQAIMEGLSRWKQSDQWNREAGQYIPYPATWLNKRRWEDDIPNPAPAPAAQPARTVTAQQYTQRNYDDEQADALRRMLEGRI